MKFTKIIATTLMTLSLISILPTYSAFADTEAEELIASAEKVHLDDTSNIYYKKDNKYYMIKGDVIAKNCIWGKNYAKEDGSLAHNEWVYITYKTYDVLTEGDKWVSAWRYYGDDFEPLVGMHTIDGKKYILGPNLGMGWFKPPKCVGKGWYYSNPNDGSIKAGWVQDGNDWYYVDDNGRMLRNTYVDGCKLNNNGKWVK